MDIYKKKEVHFTNWYLGLLAALLCLLTKQVHYEFIQIGNVAAKILSDMSLHVIKVSDMNTLVDSL